MHINPKNMKHEKHENECIKDNSFSFSWTLRYLKSMLQLFRNVLGSTNSDLTSHHADFGIRSSANSSITRPRSGNSGM